MEHPFHSLRELKNKKGRKKTMELRSPCLVLNLLPRALLNPKHSLSLSKTPISVKEMPIALTKTGLISFVGILPRSATSGDTSTRIYQQFDERHSEVILTEEVHDVPDEPSQPTTIEVLPVASEEALFPSTEASADAQLETLQFLYELKTKFNPEDAYSILLYGSGALVAVWISSAIISAIDSIPLFPKVLEIVGFAFTIWFSYRYLIFKKNRDELAAKIEELKQDVIGGSTDD